MQPIDGTMGTSDPPIIIQTPVPELTPDERACLPAGTVVRVLNNAGHPIGGCGTLTGKIWDDRYPFVCLFDPRNGYTIAPSAGLPPSQFEFHILVRGDGTANTVGLSWELWKRLSPEQRKIREITRAEYDAL